ncbi:MAG: capsular biosynthesis protein, partial [Chloroflexota bacterium]
MMLDPAAMSSPPLVQTEVPNLMVLPSGVLPPVPADVLSSQRMLDVIGVLKARAHYILFEAPPVLAATDAALLGAKLDGVVLVVRVGATRRDQAARARQALERVHVRVLGAVMTNAPRESVGSY